MKQVAYPARADRVFKVFAADSFGRGSRFSPDAIVDQEYCFSILGCDVESIWPTRLKSSGEKDGLCWTSRSKGDNELWTSMSGTSFATPIVASLVAIIYHFHDANKAIIKLHPQSMGLKTISGVKAILLKMSHMSIRDGYNFLNPMEGREGWFLFHKEKGESMTSFFGAQLTGAIWNARV